jgi:hypothetical protein
MSGKPLYPALDALSANNYPPLSFYAAGWLGCWLGDYLFAGRLLAFIGIFTSAVVVAAVVKQLTGRIRAALMSGLLLLGYNAALYPAYVGLDEPQWLGHGIMLLGLLAFLASEQRGSLFLLSAGLMIVAGFVKQILLPIPLAATLWLLLYRREVLLLWLATSVALLVSAFALCFTVYGSGFFEGVFRDARDWSLVTAYFQGGLQFQRALPLLLLGTLVLPAAWRRVEGRLVVFYAAISAALAIYFLGGSGVDMNAIFDLEIALCLVLGLAIGQLEENGRSAPVEVSSGMAPGPIGAAWWGLLLVLVLGLHLPRRLLDVRQLWDYGRPREAETAEVIDLLAKQPGPVACERLSLCYWAGKGFEIDFFQLGQKLNQGFMDPRVVTERLRSHYYAAIQTEANDGRSWRLPPGINQEIADNYEVERTTPDEGALLLPRIPVQRYAAFDIRPGGACNFDHVRLSADEVILSGWGILSGEGAPADAVLLQLDVAGSSRRIVADRTERPDVAVSYKNDALKMSGFTTVVKRQAGMNVKLLQAFQAHLYVCPIDFDVP